MCKKLFYCEQGKHHFESTTFENINGNENAFCPICKIDVLVAKKDNIERGAR